MEKETIIIYCKRDSHNRIVAVNNSIFLTDLAGWQELDRSDSGSRTNRDAYTHAQANYFPDRLTDDTGAHRYIYDDTSSPKYCEATPEEMQAERNTFPKLQLTAQEETNLQLLDLDYRMTLLENGMKESDFI